MGDTLRISRSVRDAIVAEAAGTAAEICGLLFGRPRHEEAASWVAGHRPCRNVAADPARHFEIDPAALIAAHRAARAGGPAIVGHYHSHPSGDPGPSATDAATAEPNGAIWLIVAGGRIAAWRAVRDGAVHGRFDSLTLVVADATPLRHGDRMTISPVDFASLLCSRLCHDLLSPVGALNNGLELLADETDPAMRERCMELLADSARTSANKLKFFRLAFGAAGGFGELVDSREAQVAIDGLLGENKRLTVNWLVEEPQLPKTAIKVLLNLSMIAGDALVRGGTLDIGGEATDGAVEIVLKAEGPRIVLDEEMRTTLVDGGAGAAITPRAAAAYLVHALAVEAGGSVQVSAPVETILLFGATLPTR